MSHDVLDEFRRIEDSRECEDEWGMAVKLAAEIVRLRAELESCRERIRRVEALADALEAEKFPATEVGQTIQSTQVHCVGRIRAALNAPASKGGSNGE